MNIMGIERWLILKYKGTPMFESLPLQHGFFQRGLLIFVIAIGVTLIRSQDMIRNNISLSQLGLLAFLTVLSAIFMARWRISRLSKMTKEKMAIKEIKEIRMKARSPILVASGVAAGLSLNRFLSRSILTETQHNIIVLLFGFVLFTGSIFLSTQLFYRVYLINKYCPYLKTPKDRKYDEDIEQD